MFTEWSSKAVLCLAHVERHTPHSSMCFSLKKARARHPFWLLHVSLHLVMCPQLIFTTPVMGNWSHVLLLISRNSRRLEPQNGPFCAEVRSWRKVWVPIYMKYSSKWAETKAAESLSMQTDGEQRESEHLMGPTNSLMRHNSCYNRVHENWHSPQFATTLVPLQ